MMNDLRRTDARLDDRSALRIHCYGFRRRGYTLVELFLTLAVLMIVLGLIINLGKRVRGEAADRVTRQMLQQLEVKISRYARENDEQLPPVTPLIDTAHPRESDLLKSARQNSADICRYLQLDQLAAQSAAKQGPFAGRFERDGNQLMLVDPWGSPIVFMPSENPAIGWAPRNVYYFVSAGPDRLYLTHEDNLYSYDETGLGSAE